MEVALHGLIARRLFATLFWSALAFAVGLPTYVLVVRVHDAVVVQRDVECYERELAALTAERCADKDPVCRDEVAHSSAAADKCHMAADAGEPMLWVSKNGWDEHKLADLRPSDTVLMVFAFVAFAGTPLALLVLLRALYRWMTKPAKATS